MECLPPVKNVILGEAKTLKEETEYYLKLRRESNRILWPSSSYWKSTYIFPSELKQKNHLITLTHIHDTWYQWASVFNHALQWKKQ